MSSLMKMVLSLSLSGSLLFFGVLGMVRLGQNRFSKAWQYYVWLLVALRLLVPVTASVSLLGSVWAMPPSAAISQTAPTDDTQQNVLAVPMSQEETVLFRPVPQGWRVLQAGSIQAEQRLWIPWIVVALLLVMQKAVQYRRFVSCVCARRKAVPNPEQLSLLGSLCDELGLRRKVALYVCPQAPSPLVVGFFKPKIVLPSTDLSQEELRSILLHELTHARRHDQLVKGLLQMVLCVHWFNPLVYAFVRTVNRACELACDEAVLRHLDANGVFAYGNLLIDSLHASEKNQQVLLGSALQGNAKEVKERLRAMRAYRKPSKAAGRLAIALTLLLAVGGVALGAFVPGPALAAAAQNTAEEGIRIIQEDEEMTLDGKALFSYTSGELYALWKEKALGATGAASIGYSGYAGEAPEEDPIGLVFPMGPASHLKTFASETDGISNREALIPLPLEDTNYPVTAVWIADTGIGGPFGIEVGMTVSTLQSLLPEAAETLFPEAEEYDALYSTRYQDAGGAGFTLKAYSLMDMVSLYTVTRE